MDEAVDGLTAVLRAAEKDSRAGYRGRDASGYNIPDVIDDAKTADLKSVCDRFWRRWLSVERLLMS